MLESLAKNVACLLCWSLFLIKLQACKNESKNVKNELKKACGPDGIPPEVFKYCDLDDIMLEFANNLLNGHKPAQWSKSDLKPLPKSGDWSSTETTEVFLSLLLQQRL